MAIYLPVIGTPGITPGTAIDLSTAVGFSGNLDVRSNVLHSVVTSFHF